MTLCIGVRYELGRELKREAEGLDRAAKRFKYITEENGEEGMRSWKTKRENWKA